ncbi:MAG: hypothetical protein MHM6MM_001019 [Cercozoa sp. M6MM]
MGSRDRSLRQRRKKDGDTQKPARVPKKDRPAVLAPRRADSLTGRVLRPLMAFAFTIVFLMVTNIVMGIRFTGEKPKTVEDLLGSRSYVPVRALTSLKKHQVHELFSLADAPEELVVLNGDLRVGLFPVGVLPLFDLYFNKGALGGKLVGAQVECDSARLCKGELWLGAGAERNGLEIHQRIPLTGQLTKSRLDQDGANVLLLTPADAESSFLVSHLTIELRQISPLMYIGMATHPLFGGWLNPVPLIFPFVPSGMAEVTGISRASS